VRSLLRKRIHLASTPSLLVVVLGCFLSAGTGNLSPVAFSHTPSSPVATTVGETAEDDDDEDGKDFGVDAKPMLQRASQCLITNRGVVRPIDRSQLPAVPG
jgi:hypothetical protein